MGTLQLNASTLELDGQALHAGNALELWIFDSWIAGTLTCDHSGWSLLTARQVHIRLSQGLLARLLPPRPHEGGAGAHGSGQEIDGM